MNKSIDFTPQWYRVRLQTVRERRRRLGYLGAVLVMMAGWLMQNMTQVRQAHAALQTVRQEHGKAATREARMQALGIRRDRLNAQLLRFQQVARQLAMTVIFAEITHWMPAETQLTSFKIEKIADKPTGPESAMALKYRRSEWVVSMKARAPKEDLLLELVLNLLQSPLFEGVDFDSVLLDPEQGFTRDIKLYVYRSEYIAP